jgi:Sulfotransferase family
MFALTTGTAPQAMRLLRAARRPRFALENLRYHVGLRPSPESHIFVMGPPRSGTTLVRQMLLAHPLLTGPDRETYFFLRWNLYDFPSMRFPLVRWQKSRRILRLA